MKYRKVCSTYLRLLIVVAISFSFVGESLGRDLHKVDTFPIGGDRDSIQKSIKTHQYYRIDDWDIPEYIRKMEELYGVKFRIMEGMPNKRFTITRLDKEDPLEFYLGLLRVMTVFNYVIKGREILLYPPDELE